MNSYRIGYTDEYRQYWVRTFKTRATTRNGIIRAASKALAYCALSGEIYPDVDVWRVLDEHTDTLDLAMQLDSQERRYLRKQIANHVFDLRYA